jgi:hypothetical protein
MRITDTNRLTRADSKKSKKTGSDGGEKFNVSGQSGEARGPSHSAPSQEVGSIDALLALQAVEDPTFAKKKSIKRGHDLLDGLERIKTDLLVGRVPESRLENMLNLVKKARSKSDPALDNIIDEIELRVRVELAKLNKY